ncbi:GtrA family protein [Streptomyces venezuelae]|uniref:GtrA family protein n=1 Tax=Streptomyces venezuelae TaxID=54571 RepID=UPI00365C5EAA
MASTEHRQAKAKSRNSNDNGNGNTDSNSNSQGPGALHAFARFVLCGGGVGLASSFAVAGLALSLPWAVANALVTVVSTVLATELHARFTFGAGGRATWRQHVQSAGSAAAAYVVTCGAMLVLQQLVTAPGAVLEQVVYLSASALAGVARFAVLRVVVFARDRRPKTAPHGAACPASVTVARATAPTRPATLCPAALCPAA